MTDDLASIRELLRLLRDVPFSEWPQLDVTPQPYDIRLAPADPVELAAFLAELRAEQRKQNDDLNLQTGRVEYSLELIRGGEEKTFEWPDAPMRVAILLRKRGETELERDFLEAFVRRLRSAQGARFRKLVERREKLGKAQ